MSEELLRKLGIQTGQEDLATMPQLGVAFAAGTIIAPFSSKFLYQILTQEKWSEIEDPTDEEGNPIEIAPFLVQDYGEWKSLLYEDYATAKAAADLFSPDTKDRNRPRQMWVLYGATRDVLNSKDLDAMVEAFGADMLYSVRVMTPRKASKAMASKDRHEFISVALPSAVAAVANALGYDNPGFDLTELTKAQEDDTFTDERFKLLVGDPEGNYENCHFWNQRVDLWAALGESDPKKQAVRGSLSASGKPNNLATNSDKLSNCLAFIQGTWTKPVYLEITNVKNPRPDAVGNTGRRRTIPCITKIYLDRESARADALAQLSESEGDEPPMPADPNWQGYRQQWIEFVTNFQIPTGPAPVVAKAYQEAGATPEEVRTWKEFLGLL